MCVPRGNGGSAGSCAWTGDLSALVNHLAKECTAPVVCTHGGCGECTTNWRLQFFEQACFVFSQAKDCSHVCSRSTRRAAPLEESTARGAARGCAGRHWLRTKGRSVPCALSNAFSGTLAAKPGSRSRTTTSTSRKTSWFTFVSRAHFWKKRLVTNHSENMRASYPNTVRVHGKEDEKVRRVPCQGVHGNVRKLPVAGAGKRKAERTIDCWHLNNDKLTHKRDQVHCIRN